MEKEEKIDRKDGDDYFQRYMAEHYEGNQQQLEKKTQISVTQDVKSSSQEFIISWDLLEQQREKMLVQMKNIVVIRQGYLQKQIKGILNNSQICFCILTSYKLYCYQDQKRLKLISCINFRFNRYIVTLKQLSIGLECKSFKEAVVLKAYSKNQIQAWHRDLGKVIQVHDGFEKITFLQKRKDIYQEKDALTQIQFLALAETGDLILMSTKAKGMLQRIVTNSQYDHIGIIVKFINGRVKIFESNPDQGVTIYDWPKYQMIFHHYQQMTLRKLHVKDRESFQEPIQKFIKANIGKRYDLSLLKLLRSNSEQNHSDESYFCSQLVAKVYKLLGLLSQDVPSNKYWPIDFTERGCLILQKEASLSEQRQIILNKHLKL